MALSDRVCIARRFLRSIRIDSDFGDTASLEGFICPQSFADVLLTMARHVSETGQGAYTWTGPYGSGKSSLVIALSALLNGNAGLQREAARVFGQKLTRTMQGHIADGHEGMAHRSRRCATRRSRRCHRRSREADGACIPSGRAAAGPKPT